MKHNTVAPARERIVLADALRGFALMGLFIVHMVEYFELYWYKPEPGWIHNLIFFLFGGKAYGIFALLFGLSFHIILDNYKRRGVDFRLRFCWRLLLLLAVGYLHSLLYAGDILQLLALCGFLLAATHPLSNRWLIGFAVFFLLQIPHIFMVVLHALGLFPVYGQPYFYNLMGQNFEVFAHGSLAQLVSYNVFTGQFGKWAFFLETGRLWNIVGLMFIGALLGRWRLFECKSFNTSWVLFYLLCSLAIYGVLQASTAAIGAMFTQKMASWAVSELLGYYANLALITAGVLVFILLFQWRFSHWLVAAFAPVGRVTLTFYLLQSLVFVPVFYGFGLGAYEYLGQGWSLVLGLVFWLLQLLLAGVWLKRFRYGPAEWGWRKLTFLNFSSRS